MNTKLTFSRNRKTRDGGAERIFTSIMLWLILVILYPGCKDQIQNTKPAAVVKTGTVLLHLPDIHSRTLQIPDQVTDYSILIYNSTTANPTTVSSDTESPISLSVAEGDYSITVLAGYCETSGEYVLLGSGVTGNITVAAEATTQVSVTMSPVTFQFTVPESVECGTPYTISVEGSTGSANIQVSLEGSYSSEKPYIRFTGDTSNYYLAGEQTADLWSASTECTAPVIPEESILYFYGSKIILYDEDWSINSPISDLCGLDWRWLNYPDLSDSPALLEEVFRDISFTASTTGISLAISWE